MKAVLILGVVLILFGLFSLITGGFNYTTREKVVDIGPIEATAETEKQVSIPPLVGGIALAAGVVLVMSGARRK